MSIPLLSQLVSTTNNFVAWRNYFDYMLIKYKILYTDGNTWHTIQEQCRMKSGLYWSLFPSTKGYF